MHKRIKLVILLIFIVNSFLFGQGVKFEFMSLNTALAKAKKENKIIFIHNGERCGWGDRSLKSLEASTDAGDFFNKNFINIRAKNEYEIEAIFSIYDFPRYFFIKPDGEIMMMVSTYHDPEKLIRLGEKVLKGKVIKPNLSMYTAKMYPKNKKTLKMLGYTIQAFQNFNFPKDINYSKLDYNIKGEFHISDLEDSKSKLHESFKYGKYYYNQFLMVLIYETSGEKQKSKELAKKILIEYPYQDYMKERVLTDNILTQIISN